MTQRTLFVLALRQTVIAVPSKIPADFIEDDFANAQPHQI